MPQLRDRQEYIDRYDKLTVDDCRWRENFHINYSNTLDNKTEEEREAIRHLGQVAWNIEKILVTLDWYDKKEDTIQKWMTDDERRDRKLEQTPIPANIFCDTCYSLMQYESKHLWDHDEKERVLFFFDCPKGCQKRKAIYDDGTQYLPKPHLCEKCNQAVEINRQKRDENTIQTTYTCTTCGHEELDTFDLSSKEEIEDPKYDYDRARFCLSGEELSKAQEAKRNMDSLSALMDRVKERDEKKDLYNKVEQIKKLTVPQVKELVSGVLEKEQYLNILFDKPDLGRIVSLSFSVEELKTDNERVSITKLKKLLDKTLSDTSWRLMTEGISYRLGVLSGRVRVYESDEELVKLIEKNN